MKTCYNPGSQRVLYHKNKKKKVLGTTKAHRYPYAYKGIPNDPLLQFGTSRKSERKGRKEEAGVVKTSPLILREGEKRKLS